MRVTIDFKFRTDTAEDAMRLSELITGPAKGGLAIDGRVLTYHKVIMSREELDEMTWYIEELPMNLAKNHEIAFEYNGDLDQFDECTQIEVEYRNGKMRYYDIEEDGCYVGVKKDGKIKLKACDDDEYAMFLD